MCVTVCWTSAHPCLSLSSPITILSPVINWLVHLWNAPNRCFCSIPQLLPSIVARGPTCLKFRISTHLQNQGRTLNVFFVLFYSNFIFSVILMRKERFGVKRGRVTSHCPWWLLKPSESSSELLMDLISVTTLTTQWTEISGRCCTTLTWARPLQISVCTLVWVSQSLC